MNKFNLKKNKRVKAKTLTRPNVNSLQRQMSFGPKRGPGKSLQMFLTFYSKLNWVNTCVCIPLTKNCPKFNECVRVSLFLKSNFSSLAVPGVNKNKYFKCLVESTRKVFFYFNDTSHYTHKLEHVSIKNENQCQSIVPKSVRDADE